MDVATGASVLRVSGASGGLGTSTLAVAVAVVGAATGLRTVLVDAAAVPGPLDVTACVEHRAGLRWGDLVGLRGAADGAALWRGLPESEGVRVLSGGPGGGEEVGSPEVDVGLAAEVVQALAGVADLVVLDVGRWDPGRPVPGGPAADVLVVGSTARRVADAVQVADGWGVAAAPGGAGPGGAGPGGAALPHLVVRGSPELADPMAQHLDLPLLAAWADDGRVAAAAERGAVPGVGRGRVPTLAGEVLRWALRAGPGSGSVSRAASVGRTTVGRTSVGRAS